MQFRKKLPSLTALVALEAAIRHRSFTAAANELGVTQAAVSRMIALLEEDFGRPLFHRGHRSIEPTPACLILGATLGDSLSNIADSVDAVRASTTDLVTIGATIAFSSLWLLPKIAEFRQLNPGIQIRVISQDSKLDLTNGGIDIAIRFGIPPFSDGTVLASFGDRVYPVCSPAYAASHDVTDFPGGDYELIETDVPNRSWYRWPDWFERLGQKPRVLRSTLRFSHYTETISAARAGQGMALGWDALIRPFLEDGSLIKVGAIEFEAESRYNILVPVHTKRSAIADFTAGWLTQALQR
ncbi:LysR substrate-binding domain-containing protein [Pararhizobium sp.]|uniref:LysR substrate-binding domain-containing protein n=1 Tax=Pararhizobium sp. TaxID=1977563 RepID=UPI00271D46AF|nr:LysR substrate-binding domain-containing protein [Pararhizobium sp.]MDO9415990.1 LysR substrate-binding domain-containing protein [Pararhizobium sp.]